MLQQQKVYKLVKTIQKLKCDQLCLSVLLFQHFILYHKKGYPICTGYGTCIMECTVQLEMSEGLNLNLAKTNRYHPAFYLLLIYLQYMHPRTTLNSEQ